MVLGEQTGTYNIVHVPAHISCVSNNICLKFLRVIPTLKPWNTVPTILTKFLTYHLEVYMAYLFIQFYSDILSDIFSGINFDILSDILSGIYSDILSGILSGIYSDILPSIFSDIHSGILSGIYSDFLFGILIWHCLWCPRSGSAHWDLELAVVFRGCRRRRS